jgi:hypothetical protein
MPEATYMEFDGPEHQVDVPIGISLMRGAVENNAAGIDADRGGERACATCHVYGSSSISVQACAAFAGQDAELARLSGLQA